MPSSTASESAEVSQRVTITLDRHGLKPPVYIAGSFTSIPWEAEEMEASTTTPENDDILFTKTFYLLPGEYHYKFRLGDGDWWICDESGLVVKDDAGNSNNQLIVSPLNEIHPSSLDKTPDIQYPKETEEKEPSSAPETQTLKVPTEHENKVELPDVSHEGFLGTWEPNEELSPMHRRASTSLGIQISRIGTFLPPEPTPDLEDSDLEMFPTNRKDILARMEKIRRDLPEDDCSYLEETLHTELPEHMKSIASSTSSSSSDESATDAARPNPSVANIDGISETMPREVKITPPSVNDTPIYGKNSGLGRSYGTLTVHGTQGSVDAQTDQPHVSQSEQNKSNTVEPSAPSPITPKTESRESRRGSDTSNNSGVEKKDEPNTGKERIKIIWLFAIIVSWLGGFWNWLLKGRKQRGSEAATTEE